MRIISGDKRRLPLFTPKGNKIRPTSDKIKETLFNMIGDNLYDSVFVDLFSGTGQIGIEAISRGARLGVFIDFDKDALKLTGENIKRADMEDKSIIYRGNLPAHISKLNNLDDITYIFMDPPYKAGLYETTIKEIASLRGFNEDSVLIAESPLNEDFSFVRNFGLFVIKEKNYKTSKHVFIKRTTEDI